VVKYRSGRINEEIKREVSDIIHNEVRDPRLTAMVSVTRVDVTKDLRYAKIFVSIFGNEEEKKNSLSALKNSSGFIRREIGHRVNLRHTPEISVELDNSIEHGMHINALLEGIKEKTTHDNE
jgi:ribosome-binding factor A